MIEAVGHGIRKKGPQMGAIIPRNAVVVGLESERMRRAPGAAECRVRFASSLFVEAENQVF